MRYQNLILPSPEAVNNIFVKTVNDVYCTARLTNKLIQFALLIQFSLDLE